MNGGSRSGDPACSAGPAFESVPASWSLIAWAAVLALVCALTIPTLSRSPTIGLDEIMFIDPAVNFVAGRGFTSSAWPTQGENEWFVGNAPLYTLLGIPWVATFGVSAPAVRGLSFTLMLGASFVFTLALIRLRLVRNPIAMALVLLSIFGADGTAVSYRYARYDVLGFGLISAVLLAASIRHVPIRLAAIALLSLPIGPAGYQNLSVLIPFAAAALIATHGTRWREVLASLAGAAAGMVMLGLFLHFAGLLQSAITAMEYARNSYHGDKPLARRIWWGMTNEIGGKVISLTALAYAVIALLRSKLPRQLLPAAYAVGFAIVIPVFVSICGRMPPYYTWFRVVPVAIALGVCVDRLLVPGAVTRVWKWTALAVVGVGMLMTSAGLFYRSGLAVLEWNERDPAPLESFVRAQLRPDDVVFASPPAYYELRRLGATAYFPWYRDFTSAEAARITLVISSIDDLHLVWPRLNAPAGEWIEVGRYNSAAGSTRFQFGPRGLPYRLAAYRRVGAAALPAP